MLIQFLIKILIWQIVFTTCSVLTLTVTTGHCHKNMTIKYQVLVTKTRLKANTNNLEHYAEWQDRIRVDKVRICCPGYRTIIFGLCEPICEDKCPKNSYCAEPNKCICNRGYEASHNHHVRSINLHNQQRLQCRPKCSGGCPASHSYCVAHNQCACRAGYKDVSSWFSPLRCEHIQCPGDLVYDITQHKCLKVDMNLEQLMEKVAQKLAHGLNELDYDDDSVENAETTSKYNIRED